MTTEQRETNAQLSAKPPATLRRLCVSNRLLLLFALTFAGCDRCDDCFDLDFGSSSCLTLTVEGAPCLEEADCVEDGWFGPTTLLCVDSICRRECADDWGCIQDSVIIDGRCDLATRTCADPDGPGEFAPLTPPEEEPYGGPQCDLGAGARCTAASDSNDTTSCDVEARRCRARCGPEQPRPLCDRGYACLDGEDGLVCIPGECNLERWWEPCTDSTCAPVWEGHAAFCSPAGIAEEGELCRDESELAAERCREPMLCISERCRDTCTLDRTPCGFQDCVAALPLSPAGQLGVCATPCNPGECPGGTWCAPIFYRAHSIAWQCRRPFEGPVAREPCDPDESLFCSTGVLCDPELSECREICVEGDICPGGRPCDFQQGQVFGLCRR